jgi:hypothetical protein
MFWVRVHGLKSFVTDFSCVAFHARRRRNEIVSASTSIYLGTSRRWRVSVLLKRYKVKFITRAFCIHALLCLRLCRIEVYRKSKRGASGTPSNGVKILQRVAKYMPFLPTVVLNCQKFSNAEIFVDNSCNP